MIVGWKDGWWVDENDSRVAFDPRVTQINGKDYVPLSPADPRFPDQGTPQSYLKDSTTANALDGMQDAFTQGPDGQWYMSTDAQGKASDALGVRNHGFLDSLLTMSPMILGSIFSGAALGGAFPGVGASGAAIPAGQTGILSQLGLSNPFGSLSGTGGVENLVGGTGSDTLGGGTTLADLRNTISPDFAQNIPGISTAAGAAALPGVAQGAFGAGSSIWGPIATVGSSIISGLLQSNAARNAADTASGAQITASQAGIGELRRQFDAIQALLKPYTDAGPSALRGQQDLLGLNGAPAQQTAITALEGSPEFASLTKQGESAILQNASATGGLRGGNVQAALAKFRPQVLAKLINDQYSRLGGITSLGQNAAAGVGNAGMNTGTNVANLLQQAGAAQAGNALARGTADARLASGITNGIGTAAGLGVFDKLPNLNLF